jgi:hypothetical protein
MLLQHCILLLQHTTEPPDVVLQPQIKKPWQQISEHITSIISDFIPFPLMSISTTVFAPCFAAINCALMFLKYSPNLLPSTWVLLLKVQGNQLLTRASSMTSVIC